MRQPCIIALTALDDPKALTALAVPIVGNNYHLFLRAPEGDALVIPLGERIVLDGLYGQYTIVMLMPHSDGKGGMEHGPKIDTRLTASTAAEASKAAAELRAPGIRGPWPLDEFVSRFPDAERALARRLLDGDGVLRCPQVFMGDDSYALCGTIPKEAMSDER